MTSGYLVKQQHNSNLSSLIEGPVLATLIIFALPALGSNILQTINGSINALWVGQFLGARGLAATANANIIVFMMLSLVFGFAMATTIVIGQALGRGDVIAMRRALGAGLGLFVILGMVTAVLGWLLSPALLHFLGTPAEVYNWALVYLRIMFLGLPLALIMVFMAMALRSAGDSLTPLLLQVPGMLLDIGLNPVLIRGLWGAPRLGIAGSALATLLANLVSMLLMIGFIYRRDLPVRLRGKEWRFLFPQFSLLRVIIGKGIPMGLQMIVLSGSTLVLLGFVNKGGTDVVAAYGANTQLWTYIQMPGMAIGMAVSAMAAQNIGAGRWDRVTAITRAGVLVNLALTGLLVSLVYLLDQQLLGLFLRDNAAALSVGRTITRMAAWGFVLISSTLVLSGVPRANGATFAPLVIMTIAYIPGRLGSILILEPWLGLEAIWWSFPVGGAISLALTAAYYLKGDWRKASLIATVDEAEEFVQAESDPAGRMLPTA
jgi:putative MATE family efflux protein